MSIIPEDKLPRRRQSFKRVIDIREGFPKFMRVSPEGLALFLVEFVRVIREGCS